MNRLQASLRRQQSERGAILTFVALSLVSIVAVMGVVLDGGNVFSQRRQMQNAADAAATAGARALDRLALGNEGAIWSAVVASAVSNGGDSTQITCRLTNEVLVDVGACPQSATNTAASIKSAASAVRVTVAATHKTTFIRVVGAKTFTARASAAGQIEALRSGSSPFVLCAVGRTDPRAQGDGQTVAVLLPDNSINPAALYANGGPTYELQNPTTIGCGQGNNFKGLSENATANYTMPGPWTVANGDHGINVAKSVVAGNNACSNGITLNCVILVPLCHATTPATDGSLYCVRFGAFQIVDIQGASRISGRLVDGVVATGGQGGGPPLKGEARVVKLSE